MVIKLGDRVKRDGKTGLVTRVSPGGKTIVVRVGTVASGTMAEWKVAEVTK